MRGFDYHEIGEVNANGNIIGGKYLAVASAEYEYYFSEDWGAAVFVDAGDAFTDALQRERRRGRGRALALAAGADPRRCRVPGADRSADCRHRWRLHVLLGPDL